MNKQPISRAGFDRLQSELRHLTEVERPAILTAVHTARELGDLSENADYKTAKDDQRRIDRDIARLESILKNANVIDTAALSGDSVMFGAMVSLEDEDGRKVRYRILAECEANAAAGIISNTSPLARAMIGKSKGDAFVVRMPGGEKEFEIIDVKYGD
ncbi:MAG: transcription elongation factor GreA [Rickettsiales bacterium]|jgi:transcription elongation factor GreA|nr:transcription elongation factor GreA [Rickettsiales bacterium]